MTPDANHQVEWGRAGVGIDRDTVAAMFSFLLLLSFLPVSPLAKDLQAIVTPARGVVGFAALELGSGGTLGVRAHEAFPMQSVFKLPVALEVLRLVDTRKLDLTRVVALNAEDARAGLAHGIAVPSQHTVAELLEAMLIESDNVACDKLLTLVGGPAAVDARVQALGVSDIHIRFSELELGRGRGDNTATPGAMVVLLAKVARGEEGLSPASHARLEDLLLRVGTGPRRLKGALPQGTPVAHKTGTSDTTGGSTDATNDVGLVTLPDGRRFAVAVFVHASPADQDTRERTIASLARLAFDLFRASPPRPAP